VADSVTTSKTSDGSTLARRITIAVLVIVGCLAIALGNLYSWVVRTTLTDDAWVAVTVPLAREPAVQRAVGTLILERIDEAVDIEGQIAERLPDQLDPLAAFVATQARQALSQVVFELLASDAFADAWETAMREGHARIIRLIRETTVDPTIPLRIDAIVATLDQRLAARGIDVFPGDGPPSLGDLAIRVDERLAQARALIGWAEQLVWILPLVALAAFVAALALARRRGRLFVAIATSVAVALAIELVAFRVVEAEVASIPSQEVFAAGVDALLTILLAGLYAQTQALLVAAAVIAIVAWVARYAARLKPIRAFLARYGRLLQAIVAVVVGAYLLFGPDVRLARVLLVGALAVAAVLGLEAVIRGEAAIRGESGEPLEAEAEAETPELEAETPELDAAR
jgi:hypothetical protein